MSSTQIDYDRIAELYDIYAASAHDLAFFLQEAANAGGHVLELMAGTGRLSIPLCEAGVQLTCVDGAQGMLNVLSRKLKARGLSAEVVCADICHLELGARFRLALLPSQSFMELVGEPRQRQALASVFSCLVPGGSFICTMHNPAVRRAQVDGFLRLVGRFPTQDGELVVSGFEQGGHPVVKRLQFFELYGSDGRLGWKQLLPMEFELIEPERFESMARDAGFRVAALYGDYECAPFDAPASPVMVWVLEKPDS